MIIARSSQSWLKHFKLDKAMWTDWWCTSDTAFTKQIPALIFCGNNDPLKLPICFLT